MKPAATLRHLLMLSGATAVCMFAAPVLAADDGDRDYLPDTIVVTGVRDGYVLEDGSTGTKTPTPLIEVPQTITFLTADQLEDQSIRQLGDALRYVPGISLETGEGHRDEVFIRGQETTADFYLDGLRDDAQYYRSLYNVERIEILKGANALIFGRGGGGGVINRVSKTARLNGFSADLSGSVDNFGAFALSGDVNTRLSEPAALRINATYEEFDNDRQAYEGRFIGISPTATVQLGDASRFIASYSYDDDERVTDRGIPSLNGGPLRGFDDTFFGVPGFNNATNTAHIARGRLEHDFSDSLSGNATAQYANYDKFYANVVPSGITGAYVDLGGYADFTKRENWIGQGNLVWQVETGALAHTILAGIEAMEQTTRNGRYGISLSESSVPLAQTLAYPTVTLGALSRERKSRLDVLSAYIQDQVEIGEYVELTAGLRWERFDLQSTDLFTQVEGGRIDEMVSPRFGLVVKPNSTLSIYASYAESFLPQAGDQFVILSPGDSAFDPEKFTNYELGLKWAPASELLLTAAIFRLDRTNTQAADPVNIGQTVLTGKSRTKGFEFNLAGQITPDWSVNVGYAWLDGEIRSDSTFAAAGTPLQQLPKHQITAWTRYDLTERFGLGLGVVYQDEQFASFSGNVVLPDYIRVDSAAYFDVNDRLSFQLNIENLFDANYYPSAHGDNNIQPGDPFTARLGVRIKI
ncbi:TonB-dependent siderophore receptor [Erythrobacteraceae bacterium E2-1 Yellow Sea]|nr:TonB-dependent siderophore receptor [Erythrobacteraceae bacterium E2-1 Yellow Sea]